MLIEDQLRERLRKAEALFFGATTAGVREAAGAAAEWLKAKLEEATHHAPHPRSLSEANMDLRWCYASDLGDLIDRGQPDLWIHGHVHSRADYRIGKTRIRVR